MIRDFVLKIKTTQKDKIYDIFENNRKYICLEIDEKETIVLFKDVFSLLKEKEIDVLNSIFKKQFDN